MTRRQLSLLFISLCNIFLFGCNSTESIIPYKCIGQVSFRRTYAGHENWSASGLDSFVKLNPTFMSLSHASEDSALAILADLGIANKNELFLDKITSCLKDTIILTSKTNNADTVFLDYDMNKNRTSIQIRNARSADSIPIEDDFFSHTFSLVALQDKSDPYIVLINQYYIMNGDNYEISLYTKR